MTRPRRTSTEIPGGRLLSRGRLAASGLGFAAGLVVALVARWPGVAGGRPAPTEPGSRPPAAAGSVATGSSAPGAPARRDRESVIRMPGEILGEPEVRLALETLESGRLPEAAARFRTVHEKFPRHPEPLLALAKIHLSLGEPQDAVAAAGKAARLAPESEVPVLILGRALEALGDRDGAERAYLRAEELAPADPRPSYHLGRIAEARRQTDVAIARFRRALELDPGYAPATYLLADRLRSSGSHAEAARLLEDALVRAPEDGRLRLELADVRLKQGDWEAAVREFRRSAETAADDPMVPYFLGTALEQLGRDEEAIGALRTSLRQDPHLHHAWYALARLLRKTGRAAEADQARREFERTRSLQDSIVLLRGAVDRNPKDLEALLSLGELLLDRGKPDEALDAFRRALALDPASPRARELLPRAEGEARRP